MSEKHKVIKETCVAGRTIECVIKLPNGKHSGKRSKARIPSTEQQVKYNDIVAERNARRMINHNFGYGDGHYTLTYAETIAPEVADAQLAGFIRRLRYRMRKQGKQLKYFAVTEYENHRIHHHIILNTDDVALVSGLWQAGHVRATMLDRSGDYKKLANYLLKETQKSFRKPERHRKRRYSASRNLIRPEVRRETVSADYLYDDPKPIKGYYIDKDSIHRYQHPVTECEHLEYTMIAIDLPRYKKWRRGKVVQPEQPLVIRTGDTAEEQLSFVMNEEE
ncbi:MAG: hypothetical protein K5707_04260 [Clostridia bacterium]|nr:hypothetical protein [Clostridia bacterium]